MSNGSERTPEGESFADRLLRQSDDAAEAKFGERPNGTVRIEWDYMSNVRDARHQIALNRWEGTFVEKLADAVESQRSRIAALEAVIAGAREWVNDPGDHIHENLVIDIDRLSELLTLAPSTVLDQMIREAKAEAWDEGQSDGAWNEEHAGMIDSGLRQRIENPYRNGDA